MKVRERGQVRTIEIEEKRTQRSGGIHCIKLQLPTVELLKR